MNLVRNIHTAMISLVKRGKSFYHSRYGHILRNKFVFTSLLFFVWMLFFDQNNLNERRRNNNEYNQLLKEREYFQNKIEENRKRLQELKTNNDNLEKFAREQYLMKKDNEDIFIIVDE
jgi:cell division protein DivIC